MNAPFQPGEQNDLARVHPAFSDTQIRDSLIAYAETHRDESELTDDEITEWGAECGMDKPALIVRLRKYIADSEAA